MDIENWVNTRFNALWSGLLTVGKDSVSDRYQPGWELNGRKWQDGWYLSVLLYSKVDNI